MSRELSNEQINVLNQSKTIINEVKKAIVGKDEIIVKVLIAMLSGGHILLEDNPGVGKTTLALAFSKALSLDYKRLQFTPDVLPSDVTGFSIYNKTTGGFDYKEGAAMCNLFLADEINRTSSKTQSALLEVMEEGKVTVDGITHETPKPFFVIATQNPIGSIGTQMLPESQLDRFIVRLSMGYPNFSSEIDMLKARQTKNPLDDIIPVVSHLQLINSQKIIENVFIGDAIFEYITKLSNATRGNQYLKLGLSPRASIALTKVSKTTALLNGRDYVIPDDIIYCFSDVASHRLILNSNAKINSISISRVIKDILDMVPIPRVSKD